MLVLHSLAVGHEGASNLQFLPVSPERSITTPVFKTFFFEIWLPGWEAPPIRGWTLAPPSAGVSDHQWVQRFLMSRLWGRQAPRGPAGPPGPGSPPGARQSSRLQWLTVVLSCRVPWVDRCPAGVEHIWFHVCTDVCFSSSCVSPAAVTGHVTVPCASVTWF